MTTFCSRFALLHDSPWNHHPARLVRVPVDPAPLDLFGFQPLELADTVPTRAYKHLHPERRETRRRVHHYMLASLVPLRTAMFERYWRARDRETGDDE